MNKYNFSDSIIHETSDYILINKPPFIATLEDRNETTNILLEARKYHARAQVCHRLDKETSGVLAIAKNPEAYSHLAKLFEKRSVNKVYHAVSGGLHDLDTTVDAPIATLSRGIVKIDPIEGKKAVTVFKTIKAFKRHTLIECKPLTGRMHQIRVHLAVAKAPIIGDKQYGGKDLFLSSLKPNYNLKKDTEELPLIKRIALHAEKLEFEGIGNKMISVEAPYPKDFKVLIKQLERYN